MFGCTHKLLAVVCDTITARSRAHYALPQSIEQEGGNFIQLVTNRYKIVALKCVDTFNGEQKQISLRPQMKKKMTNIVRQARSWMGPLKPKRKQRIHNEKYDLPGIINDRPFIFFSVS